MSSGKYIVGVDGSQWSERAVEKAVRLAGDTGAQVKILYVLDWSSLQPIVAEGVVPPPIDAKTEEKRIFEDVLQPLVDKYQAGKVSVSTDLIWGEPVDVLHEQIKQEHATMLFVGRRGRSRFVDILLGSVANKLAHRVGVPIVLVP
ncbi:universal stress protein [Psychrobium sp. 1_MG-2023]|uniref:universal stress protein n=1 Tax=Psychrobium sp. 1_MG-2023 TaxID=3062624 RepID=UPI000C34B752|nr:universal stress protein [Psychrobium sp. 1_MG-2023]MDP2561896.1 universal stress protein [Psychrobium sp. 1_MG-2023]PKF59688.1 universal stress protein [Alteromonadales bacterium alter-6D02]